MITIDDFKKVEMRVGKVFEASRVEGSEKLLKLLVDVGEKNEAGENVSRQILSGIQKYYAPEDLMEKLVVVLVNLEPRMIMGMESRGMLIAAGDGERVIFLTPEKDIQPGAQIS